MGIDSYFFVGNFIRVPGVVLPTKTSKYGCTKGCEGKPAKTAKFCAQCGSPLDVTELSNTKVERLSPYKLAQGLLEDEFYMPEYCAGRDKHEAIWIPNKRGWGTNLQAEQSDTAQNVEVQDILASRAAFAEKYGHVLQLIKDEYGVTAELCWGVVPYAS